MKNRLQQGLLRTLQWERFSEWGVPNIIFMQVSWVAGTSTHETWDRICLTMGVYTDSYVFFRDNVNTTILFEPVLRRNETSLA